MASFRSCFRVLLPWLLCLALPQCSSDPELVIPDRPRETAGGSSNSGGSGTSGGSPGVIVGQGGDAGGAAGQGAVGGAGNEPACGDGEVQADETCDDGNSRPGDGCSGICRTEPDYDCPTPGEACVYTVVCGDGRITGDEACDDGNARAGDGCSAVCRVEVGFACTVPNKPCTPTQGSECGNAAVEFGETCDDLNTDPGDGCDGDCQREGGFSCPQPGEPCVPNEFCGDGRLTTGEVCDDGNGEPGDGCNGACKVEPFFVCPTPGRPCVSTIVCGDGAVSGDEQCDDGNASAGDGCAEDCRSVEDDFVCPARGGACAPQSCGDGVISVGRGEVCDDGNSRGGDGCSASCLVEANFSCPTAGRPCTSLVDCGDRLVMGNETCDDGNVRPNDGCSATCTLEEGWSCPPGGRCVAAECGDGIVAGIERCDDDNVTPEDGCSPTCTLELGFKCTGCSGGRTCCLTECGDGVLEGLEQCDDDNRTPFDGCSRDCSNEPRCVDALGNKRACTAVCGDGIKFPNEACDDGNQRPGDGCSPTCTIEAGYQCAVPAGDPARVTLPVTFRDFKPMGPPSDAQTPTTISAHGDFQWPGGLWSASNNPPGDYYDAGASSANRVNYDVGGITSYNRTGTHLGFVRVNLGNSADADLAGRPVFRFPSTASCPLSQTGTAGSWLRRNGVYYCANQVQSAASFGTWFVDSPYAPPVPGALTLLRCPEAGASVCGAADANTFLFDSSMMLPDGTTCTGQASCDGFFPLDTQPNVTLLNDCGERSPNGVSNAHNFHFTSEVRYWFQYQASANATLTFTGDDDVFVFVNGRLVVDIGGVHAVEGGADDGQVVLNANTTDLSGVALNLVDGSIYEIGVFQAERNTCDSNYRLQLKSFAFQSSVCEPRCGDGVVTPNEECDEGTANNTGAYGRCRADCRMGPRCGDGTKQSNEQCDNGRNVDTYTTSSGGNACAPGCLTPPSCGDGSVDGTQGEQCDDGSANNTGAYGRCRADCRIGPRCGDGIRQASEQCDDGRNDGSYGTCSPSCRFAIRCGDGVLQADRGETCDGGRANVAPASAYGDAVCTTACQPAPYCGDRSVDVAHGEGCDDGVNSGRPGSCTLDCKSWVDLPSCGDGHVDRGEECDDGSANGSARSTCDVRCRTRCGNGVKDSGEQCDDGVNDGSYGGCNPDCTRADHCGDRVVSGPEECDLGTRNQANPYGPDTCTTACRNGPYCGDLRIQVSFDEECDGASDCAADCRTTIPR